MILALETATDICSISFQDKNGNIHEKRMQRKGSHSEYVFIFISDLMKEHNFEIQDLDAVLVSNGPGSYTGLRIAASAVKGLLFGLDVDVFAANTLAGFAFSVAQTNTESSIHAVINARRTHLYHQSFRFEEELIALKNADISEITDIEANLKKGDLLIGTGVERLSESSSAEISIFGMEHITASSLIKLFNNKSRNQFFTKTTAEELESNYISSSQVNNSSV